MLSDIIDNYCTLQWKIQHGALGTTTLTIEDSMGGGAILIMIKILI